MNDDKNGWWDTEEDIMEKKPLFEKNKKYLLSIEGIDEEVMCVWDGEDFYPDENINCNCQEGLYLSGICIGVNLKNNYTINSVLDPFQRV